MSPSVTPWGFLTIVHHGLISVMMMRVSTRGSVAGSSFAVNGKSRSRDSKLNPPVCPKYDHERRKIPTETSGHTGGQIERKLETTLLSCKDWIEFQRHIFEKIEIRLCEYRPNFKRRVLQGQWNGETRLEIHTCVARSPFWNCNPVVYAHLRSFLRLVYCWQEVAAVVNELSIDRTTRFSFYM